MGQDPTTGQPVYSGLPLATSTAAPALINSINTPAPAVVGTGMSRSGLPTSHASLVPSGNHTLNSNGIGYTGQNGQTLITHGVAGGHIMHSGLNSNP